MVLPVTDMPRSMTWQRPEPQRFLPDVWHLAGIALLIVLVVYPPAPGLQRFAVDAPGADAVFDSFWGAEGSGATALRWSDGRSIVRLGGYREYRALVLSAPLTAPQYPDAPPATLTLSTDRRTIAVLDIPPRWRTYHLLLMPAAAAWQQPDLRLIGLAEASGTDDNRPLGAAIGAVRVRPLGERLPLPAALRCLTVVLVAWLARIWLQRLLHPLPATLLALALAAILVAGWYVAPALLASVQPSLWDLAVIAACGASALLYLTRHTAGAVAEHRSRAFVALFAPLGALLAISIVGSLFWRIGFDSAIMLYLGWLVDRFGEVPYRDFFEQNMPGAYLFNAAIGRIFGYSDLGFRVADSVMLLGLLTSTGFALRSLGARVAWAAPIAFGLLYLSDGMYMGLQREFVILLPISLTLLLAHPTAAHGSAWRFYARQALAGMLFGLAATVKPHAIIGLPIVATCYALARTPPGERTSLRFVVVALAAAAAGAAVPLLATAGYLWASGALPGFLDLATGYWPLYGRLDSLHRTTDDINYPLYLLRGWIELGAYHLWLIPAVIGSMVVLRHQQLDRDHRMFVWMLVALAIAYSLYPIPAGKFWTYHWLPLAYFLTILTALCFRAVSAPGTWRVAAPIVAAAVIVTAARPAPELLDQLIGRPVSSAKLERTDRIAAFLRERLQPGDRVQTLDWTGGAIHALLIAEARPATSFVEDFYFYHHISNPVIQRLRRRFLAELDQAQPRFIVQVIAEDKPWVNGPDTTRSFPELEQRLADAYRPVLTRRDVIIYERRAP